MKLDSRKDLRKFMKNSLLKIHVKIKSLPRFSDALLLSYAALISALPSTSLAQTQLMSVQTLLMACEREATDDSWLEGYCLGLVRGAASVMRMNCLDADGGWKPNPSMSMAEFPSFPAALQAFINWAKAHPEEWGSTDIAGVVLALSETFPCRR